MFSLALTTSPSSVTVESKMAAPTEFDFSVACASFQNVVQKAVDNNDPDQCFTFVESYCGNEQEKKAALDQAIRDVLRHMIVLDQGCDRYKQVIGLVVQAVLKEMCSASTPIIMLSDVFDMLVLADCEVMFNFVEDGVSTWKAEPFFDAGKNYLLRMCNALNLMSQFNVENITEYDKKPSKIPVKQEKMEVEDGEDTAANSIVIDYNLYCKFWSLQEFFHKPTQCFDKAHWRIFLMHSDEVLGAFSSYKLDDLVSQRKKLARRDDQSHNFFAKYLTSEKLLDLQLSDSNFRRYVLVQFLILFQYLTSPVRFKSATQMLSEEQTQWVKTSEERVYQLICETPPSGDKFADTVKHVLQREENWNAWKNDSCPSFEREKAKEATKPKSRPKKRRIGDDLQVSGGKIIKMGSEELTRLWNLNPDNMDACRSEKREFMPTLEEYFANAIEQNDPEAMLEEQYKDINNQNFQWKGLRLLARRSPHFFLHSNQPAMPLPSYLELMISKIAKEMPAHGTEEMKTQVGEEEEDDMKEPQEDEENGEEHEQNDKEEVNNLITRDQMVALGRQLGDNWRKLATELGFGGEDIADFEELPDEETKLPGTKMIFLWQDMDKENRVQALKDALKEIGLSSITESVFGSS
ncbi:hypothetical protein C0Q70_16790 [Pomacea canaliculata]|uniref:Death domain-containing protein n=1 Tax=Pomacea canaliculata TaxID=400727 RepID=A0A2T7NQS8_POMCA|nr:hypothetical protein C0Q70_16790 [Pomacea canaliculata]